MTTTSILGSIARWSGFPLLHFLRYFKDEILITLATCSTEAVLPRMMVKLERLGCERSVVGLVLPTGYTFNADGTSIYLTMATIFVAQAGAAAAVDTVVVWAAVTVWVGGLGISSRPTMLPTAVMATINAIC